MPQRSTPNVSAKKFDAGTHDELHLGPPRQIVKKRRELIQGCRQISIPIPDRSARRFDRLKDPLTHGLGLALIAIEMKHTECQRVSMMQTIKHLARAIGASIIDEEKTHVGVLSRKSLELVHWQASGLIKARNDDDS